VSKGSTDVLADALPRAEAGGRAGRRTPLRTPVLIFVLLALVITLAGYAVYRQLAVSQRAQQGRQLAAIRDLKAGEISRWYAGQLDVARAMAADPALGSAVRKWVAAGYPSPAPAEIGAIINAYRAGFGLRVVVVDASGARVFAQPLGGAPISAREVAFAQQSMARGEVRFSDLFLRPDGQPAMAFTAPAAGGLPAGAAANAAFILQIDPGQLLYPLIQRWPTISPSAETLLVQRRGGKVVYLNTLRHRAGTALRLAFSVSKEGLPAVRAVSGGHSVATGVDYRGVPVLAAVGQVPGTDWGMVSKIDLSEIDAPLRRTALIVIAGVLVAILLAGAGILLVWSRRESAQMSRQLAMERELRLSDERFQEAFVHAPVGMLLVRPDSSILSANPAICRILGYDADELRAQTFAAVTAPDDRGVMLESVAGALSGRDGSFELDQCLVHKGGEQVWARVTATLVNDADGEPAHFVFVVDDVTERLRADRARRAAEAALAELNASLELRIAARTEELAQSIEELEAFSYSVSHDLRAPLRALDGFSLALAEDYGSALDETAQDYLHRIRSASQRMAQLIDDLLQLSRVTRAEMAPEPVDLAEIAEDVVGDLRLADSSREVDVSLPSSLVVNGDAKLLEILLVNLLGNAWKFTSGKATAHIALGVEHTDHAAVYFVRDDGAGFDPVYGEKLFTPFQRLHTSEEFPGTGIGLATVKRIVRRHGGNVWAEGAVGMGTTVHFTLGERESG
jgi:PAS domain S-box-containing protein